MPIPRNWTEELVWEWLSLEGYLTEVGVPVSVGGPGGRNEADVVGATIQQSNDGSRFLDICHVEVGSLTGDLAGNAQRVTRKFSQQKMESVTQRFAIRFGASQPEKYRKLYVHVWAADVTANRLRHHPDVQRQGIEIWTMKDLYTVVLRTIQQWKAAPGYAAKSGAKVTLPESHWLLRLLDNLHESKLLSILS